MSKKLRKPTTINGHKPYYPDVDRDAPSRFGFWDGLLLVIAFAVAIALLGGM